MADLFSDNTINDATNSARSKRRSIVMVAGGLLTVALIVGGLLVYRSWYQSTQGTKATYQQGLIDLSGLTRAISEKKRDDVLAYASGQGREALARWYDNMQVIGYSYGGMVFQRDGSLQYYDPTSTKTHTLEVLAGTAKPGAMSFAALPGKTIEPAVTTTSTYRLTINTGPNYHGGFVITTMEGLDNPPWDNADLESIKDGNVTVVGVKGTADALRQVMPGAKLAAVFFQHLYSTTQLDNLSSSYVRSYLIFVSPDFKTYQNYFKRPDGKYAVISESLAVTNVFPAIDIGQAFRGTSLDGIAAPKNAAGSGVAVMRDVEGLRQYSYGRDFDSFVAGIAVHEWTHQYYEYFSTIGARPRVCAIEGIARMSDGMFTQGETDWRKANFANYAAHHTKPIFPVAEPSQTEIYGSDGAAWYSTCASLFYYLASKGHNPFEVAREVYRQASPVLAGGLDESTSVFEQIPGVTDTSAQAALRGGWDTWVRSFYH
ncbi:hypothetical protein IPM09_05195 [Candidatus Saccharibacteria bacterium]|nr:MAG: hypothetical protein IPM09_05195 [Candidatus Saccharibacteria bacterium]